MPFLIISFYIIPAEMIWWTTISGEVTSEDSDLVFIILFILFITKLTSFIVKGLQCTVSGGVDE